MAIFDETTFKQPIEINIHSIIEGSKSNLDLEKIAKKYNYKKETLEAILNRKRNVSKKNAEMLREVFRLSLDGSIELIGKIKNVI